MQDASLIELGALLELVRANAVHRIEVRAVAGGGFHLVAHLPGQPRLLRLQRGGVRVFRTLDAAGAFARRDLGVRHVDLNLSELASR